MSELTDAPVREAGTGPRKLQGSHVWYELMTTDPDGAKAFYEKVVPGWTISESIPGDQDYRMIGRGDGGFVGGFMGLTDAMCEQGARPMWMGYVGADDVDETVRRVEAKGGKALMPAFNIPQGRIAMVADPQGNPIYVMKPVPPESNPDAQSDVYDATAEQRVGWNELSTPDPVAARQFYGDLFGWTSEDFMPMGEFGEYRFWNNQGSTMGAVFGVMPGGEAGWRYYLRVPSISAAVEAVKAGGGSITSGPHDVPGGDHVIVGKDPQGATFALVGKQ